MVDGEESRRLREYVRQRCGGVQKAGDWITLVALLHAAWIYFRIEAGEAIWRDMWMLGPYLSIVSLLAAYISLATGIGQSRCAYFEKKEYPGLYCGMIFMQTIGFLVGMCLFVAWCRQAR